MSTARQVVCSGIQVVKLSVMVSSVVGFAQISSFSVMQCPGRREVCLVVVVVRMEQNYEQYNKTKY